MSKVFLTPPPLGSSYQKDFSDPIQRVPDSERGLTLSATTHELFDGTTKGTDHIPGYMGHCPSLRQTSPLVRTFGSGSSVVPPKGGWTNLTENYKLNIPGYTGYVPKSVMSSPKTHSPSLSTTTGSMARDIIGAQSVNIKLPSRKAHE